VVQTRFEARAKTNPKWRSKHDWIKKPLSWLKMTAAYRATRPILWATKIQITSKV